MIEIEYAFRKSDHELDNPRILMPDSEGKDVYHYFYEFEYPRFLEHRPMVGERIRSVNGDMVVRIVDIIHGVKTFNNKHILILVLGK